MIPLQVEGSLLQRRGGRDHLEGDVSHLNRVLGHRLQVFEKRLKAVHRQALLGPLGLGFALRLRGALSGGDH